MANLRLMLPYAWRSTLTTGASSLTLRLDQVLLVVFAPSAQLGLYAVAVTVASVTNPLNGISLALFGHLRRETVPGRAESRFRRSLLATLVLSATVALGLAVVAPVALRLVFGAAFEAAALPLRLLLPGAVAFDVLLLLNAKLYAEGRLGLTSRAAIVGALVTVGGSFSWYRGSASTAPRASRHSPTSSRLGTWPAGEHSVGLVRHQAMSDHRSCRETDGMAQSV
jgi:O-antigen/teichoic acid export membrane protein